METPDKGASCKGLLQDNANPLSSLYFVVLLQRRFSHTSDREPLLHYYKNEAFLTPGTLFERPPVHRQPVDGER